MIRDYQPADAQAVLAVNAANQPEVGPMDDAKLQLLLTEALLVRVVDIAGTVEGFMILLEEGGTYASPNYAWFCARYPTFAYVDRIALNPGARGGGWGLALYEEAVACARDNSKIALVAEVNTVPNNPRSLRFHTRFGFQEVGREQPYGGEEEVAMLAMTL